MSRHKNDLITSTWKRALRQTYQLTESAGSPEPVSPLQQYGGDDDWPGAMSAA